MTDVDKLTNNTDEASLGQLLDGALIYEVPFFQRPYRWKKQKIEGFQSDLVDLVEDGAEEDLHFMGAILVQGRRTAPAAARPFQVIDGQQRLTTVLLHLIAAIRVMEENGATDRARALFLSLIVTRSDTGGRSNLRLSPSGQDRESMNGVVRGLLATGSFADELEHEGFSFKPLTVGNGHAEKQVERNFKLCLAFMRQQYVEGAQERLESLVSAIVQRMTVVQIDIRNALDGPKIFDRLNSSQEKMTVGELVKNDIFSREAGADDLQMELLENEVWAPFFNGFDSPQLFNDYFFPYGLCVNSTWKKSEVYAGLQKDWRDRGLTPREIIEELHRWQQDFLEVATGEARSGHPKEVQAAFRRLHRSKSPSSTYPLTMQISFALREGELDPAVGLQLLERLESFLVRRSICGMEPTGLHAVFKGLWERVNDLDPLEMAQGMEDAIRSRKTVQWPRDDEVQSNLQRRNIYGSRITRYLLEEFDISYGGDHAKVDSQIEHVLPQSPSGQSPWWHSFSRQEHSDLVDTIGNLTLISEQMNKNVSNQPFELKRPVFERDAIFTSTRDLARENSEWTPDSIRARSEAISVWAVTRWQH